MFFVKAHRRFSPPPLDASPLPPVRNIQGATLLNMCRGTSPSTRSRRSRDDVFAALTYPPLRASPAPLVPAFSGSAWGVAALKAMYSAWVRRRAQISVARWCALRCLLSNRSWKTSCHSKTSSYSALWQSERKRCGPIEGEKVTRIIGASVAG